MMALVRGRPIITTPSLLLWCLVVTAWALALLLYLVGQEQLVAHDVVLVGEALPPIPTLLLFLAAWQVMTATMMLPSSLPMVGLFVRASRGQERPGLALAAFLTAYFAVWTGFAFAALLGDAGLHGLVDRWPWLAARPWLIAGAILVLAGAFQFSPLKERCLDACRTPLNFLYRYYQQGVGAAWALGLRHGLFCLGCCWALMLTMFAIGVGSLGWMAAMTGVMVIEKTTRLGRKLSPLVGTALLLWGALVLVQPDWLPASLMGR